MEISYIIYHVSVYCDMNVYHDINKIITFFTMVMPWEAYDNIIVCYDIIIKCKMSENLLGKVKQWYYLIN